MATGDGRYITIQDVRSEIPEDILARLTDDDASKDADQKVIDDTKIAAAIRYAEARIDNALAKRYKVPINLADLEEEAARDAIAQAAINLVYHKLYSRVGKPDAHSDKKKMADTFLAEVASGQRELVGAETLSRTRIKYVAPKAKFSTVDDADYDQERNP